MDITGHARTLSEWLASWVSSGGHTIHYMSNIRHIRFVIGFFKNPEMGRFLGALCCWVVENVKFVPKSGNFLEVFGRFLEVPGPVGSLGGPLFRLVVSFNMAKFHYISWEQFHVLLWILSHLQKKHKYLWWFSSVPFAEQLQRERISRSLLHK